jgi:hypothetical protein
MKSEEAEIPLLKQLPQTIEDAMELTGKVGFRYLWVDRLCITQDGLEQKAQQINEMNFIYENAVLCIVAVSGSGAYSDIPGARPGQRCNSQETKAFGGITVGFPKPGLEKLSSLQYGEDGLGQCRNS